MQDFKKKRKLPQEQIIDDYQQLVESSSKKNLQLANLKFKKVKNLQQTSQLLKTRIKHIAYNYGIATFLIFNSAVWYPFSVKFVKNVFKLKGFVNIHFGIIPIIVHINCIAGGVAQGYLNNVKFREKYYI